MDKFWEMWAMYQTIGSKQSLEDTLWGKLPAKGEEGVFQVNPETDDEEHPYTLHKGDGHDWLKSCAKDVKIKVVGVWDTVGSLGFPDTAWGNPSEKNKPYGFHNTDIHPRK